MKEMLFFFDIDGTLIDQNLGINHITTMTKESLDRLRELGNSVFLATGRCKCFILDEVNSYPFNGYVTCNGGYVEYKGEEIFKAVVSKEALKVTHDFCKKYNMICYFESSDNIYVANANNEKHLEFKKNWAMKDEIIVEEYDINEIETYLGMIVINDESEVELMKETLSPYFDVQRHQWGTSFDLTLKGVSKAMGIEKLIERLNKDISDTVAFGDGRNDVEMLQTVGLGIAMGNGANEAKAASNHVTASVEEEGITQALKYFKMI